MLCPILGSSTVGYQTSQLARMCYVWVRIHHLEARRYVVTILSACAYLWGGSFREGNLLSTIEAPNNGSVVGVPCVFSWMVINVMPMGGVVTPVDSTGDASGV